MSGKLSVVTCTEGGPSIRWSMAVARRSPLVLVEWESDAPVALAAWASEHSGSSSTAATRGSPPSPGSDSLATSSDWMTTRTAPSSGSTS